ncbi:MAG: leucine-rich repeat domain-containing protein, partial [Candidatus Methanomethylophilaceae archaeon]|nr:leucine-rich repeat domain-containing protein [Candidatus Methanomethylophilaceae archaeon]
MYVAGAVTGIASAFDEGKRDWSVIEWTSGTSYTHSTTATGFTAKGLYMMTSDNPDQVRGSGQVWIGTTTVDLGAGNSSGDRYAHLMPDDHGDLNSYTGTRACYIMMPENVGSKESGLQSPSGVNISTIWAEHNRVCTIEYFPSTFYGLSATQNAVREFVVSPLNDRLASIDGDLYIVNGSSPKLHAFADRNAGNLVVLSENANTSFYTFSDISAGMVEDAYTTNAGNQTTYQINIALMRSDASTFQARSGNAAGGVDIVVLGPDVGTYIYSNEKGSTNTWLITEPSTSGTPITLHAMSFTDGTWMDSAGNFYVSKTNNGLYKVSPTPDGQGRYPLAKQTTLPHGLVMKRIGNAPTITDNTIAQYPTGNLGLVDFESASGVQGKYLKYTYRGYTGLIVFADGKLENIPNVGANYLTLMGGIQADGSIGSLTTIGSTVLDGFSDRSSVKGIMLSYTVTTLESQCFAGAGIKYMYIPKSVTSIADDAFKGCASMYRYIVDVHNTVYTSAPVGTGTAGAKTVKDETFMIYHMTDGVVDRLVAVPAARTGGLDIPSTVTAVAPYAAYGSSLSSVSFNNVETIGDYAFYGSGLVGLDITNTITSIGDSAFQNSASIKYLTIGTGIKDGEDFGTNVFSGLTGVTMVFLSASNNPLTITSSMFGYDDGMHLFGTETLAKDFKRGYLYTSALVTFDKKCGDDVNYSFFEEAKAVVIRAGNKASATHEMWDYSSGTHDLWYNDTSVNILIVDNGVKSIGKQAFYGATNLEMVSGLSTVYKIGEQAFYNDSKITDPSVVTGSVTQIGKEAFLGTGLAGKLNITGQDATIQSGAFSGLTEITELNLAGVRTIVSATGSETGSFEGCTGITKVSFGANIDSIGDSAFKGCSGLRMIIVLGTGADLTLGTDSVPSASAGYYWYKADEETGVTSLTQLSRGTYYTLGASKVVPSAFALKTGITGSYVEGIMILSGASATMADFGDGGDKNSWDVLPGGTEITDIVNIYVSGVTNISANAFSGMTSLQ